MAAACDMLNGHQLHQFMPMGMHAPPETDPKKQICFDFTKVCKHEHRMAVSAFDAVVAAAARRSACALYATPPPARLVHRSLTCFTL